MKITISQLRLILKEQGYRSGRKDHEPTFSLDDYPGYSDFYSKKSPMYSSDWDGDDTDWDNETWHELDDDYGQYDDDGLDDLDEGIKQRFMRIIRETVSFTPNPVISPELEARVADEMGALGGVEEWGPLPGGLPFNEWDADDFMEYLSEVEYSSDYGDIPHEATVAYVKARFPEKAQEVDEIFSEEGPRYMDPPFEAFNDLVYNNVDIIGGSQDVLQGEEHTVKVSDVKKDDGTYRWWIWGNNLDPIDIDIAATGTDRDGKMWSAEEIFQTIRGGKPSKFRVPKVRGEDLY